VSHHKSNNKCLRAMMRDTFGTSCHRSIHSVLLYDVCSSTRNVQSWTNVSIITRYTCWQHCPESQSAITRLCAALYSGAELFWEYLSVIIDWLASQIALCKWYSLNGVLYETWHLDRPVCCWLKMGCELFGKLMVSYVRLIFYSLFPNCFIRAFEKCKRL